MSIIDKIKDAALNQFIEVIEWLDNTGDTPAKRRKWSRIRSPIH